MNPISLGTFQCVVISIINTMNDNFYKLSNLTSPPSPPASLVTLIHCENTWAVVAPRLLI